MVKNRPAKQDTQGPFLWLGRSLGEGNGNPLQYSCLENPIDRGSWRATVHEVTNSWTGLSTHTQNPYEQRQNKRNLNKTSAHQIQQSIAKALTSYESESEVAQLCPTLAIPWTVAY